MIKKKISNVYNSIVTFENIYNAWNIVRKTCKNKKEIYRFDLNKNTNIYNIYNSLLNKTYKPMPFKLFLIYEPKERLVMSQSISDKIVNHFISKYFLLPYLENKLIDSNVATRKNKGGRYADKLLTNYINEIRLKEKEKDIYCLSVDISKYFYNINHNILFNKLKKDIDDLDILNLLKIIIDETNKEYVNKTIYKLNEINNTNVPFYDYDIGLSIGAMTSQFLAIYYLNDLDHYIKEKLRCKYYVRYMDDFIILDTNKEKLKEIFKILEIEINKLDLKVNPKSNIKNLKNGINFLGYKYIVRNKFNIKYKSKTLYKIRHRLKLYEKYDLLKYYKSYSSYYGYLNKLNVQERNFKMKAVEKYEYYKNDNNNCIVFIKEGSSYKTYNDDAIIIWNLFNYKWNKESIAFSVNYSNKVLDELKKQDIGYLIVQDNQIYVDGNKEIYDLYRKISIINYDKYNKKCELHSLLDNIIDSNINLYDDIKLYFDSIKDGEVNEK